MDQYSINGQTLSFQTLGKGEPVLLIHGFCEDHSIWLEFLETITEEGYQFILPDLPGFGGSPLAQKTSIKEMGQMMLSLMNELGHSSFHLVGHSMGGYISLAMLEDTSEEQIRSITLFHSHPFADSQDKIAGRDKGIEFINKNGHQLYVKQLITKLFYPLFLSSNRYILDRLIFLGSNLEPRGIINALEAMRDRSDRSDNLRNATCPVAFIIGEEEKVIPADASLAQTHLPRTASIHMLPKVNHMGMFEATKKCRKILRDFWKFSASSE